MNDKPLVSLCITCYNQVKYIREAVQSAFDQTYSPLEIVICDDHSTDGTDAIIREMVEQYKKSGGRHKVIFERNDKNLYVLKNYEKAFKLASGELLVTGAGDDVSLPHRVSRIVEAWQEDGRRATCIVHAWNGINEHGRQLYVRGPWPVRSILGASATYVREVVTKFEPLPNDRTIYEDHVFSARAMMYGPCLELDEPLMNYREGTGESTCVPFLDRRRRVDHHVLASDKIIMRELEEHRSQIKPCYYTTTWEMQLWRRNRYLAEYGVCFGESFWVRLCSFFKMSKKYDWVIDNRLNNYLKYVFPDWMRPAVNPCVALANAFLKIKRHCRL